MAAASAASCLNVNWSSLTSPAVNFRSWTSKKTSLVHRKASWLGWTNLKSTNRPWRRSQNSWRSLASTKSPEVLVTMDTLTCRRPPRAQLQPCTLTLVSFSKTKGSNQSNEVNRLPLPRLNIFNLPLLHIDNGICSQRLQIACSCLRLLEPAPSSAPTCFQIWSLKSLMLNPPTANSIT